VTADNHHLFISADPAGGRHVHGLYYSTRPRSGPSAWKHVACNVTALSLACPTTSLCVAGSGGLMFMSTRPSAGGNSWTTASIGGDVVSIQAVACQGVTLCVAGDPTGNLFAGTGP
jgi:hypothetical protein